MLLEIRPAEARPDLPALTDEEAAAAARAVLNLFARWKLTDAEARGVLGGLAARTYARWKKGEIGRIDRDLGTRLSLLLGIHKGLRYLFADPERGYRWVKRRNDAFGGDTPLQVMLRGRHVLADAGAVLSRCRTRRLIRRRFRSAMFAGLRRGESSARSTHRSICSRTLPIRGIGRRWPRPRPRPIHAYGSISDGLNWCRRSGGSAVREQAS